MKGLFTALLIALVGVGISAPQSVAAHDRYGYGGSDITVRVSRSDSLWGGSRTRTQVGVRTGSTRVWVERDTYSSDRRNDCYRGRSRDYDYDYRYRGASGYGWREYDRSSINIEGPGEIRGLLNPRFWDEQRAIERERDAYYGGYGRRYRR